VQLITHKQKISSAAATKWSTNLLCSKPTVLGQKLLPAPRPPNVFWNLFLKDWKFSSDKFTRPQFNWLLYYVGSLGCNAAGRYGMICRRQRSTKLFTTFTNVRMHAFWSVVDILNNRY